MSGERSWKWEADEDTSIGDVTKTITLDERGLSYTGWGSDPIIGGGYTIGFQTVAEFLEHGPLDEGVPTKIAEAIRRELGESPVRDSNP